MIARGRIRHVAGMFEAPGRYLRIRVSGDAARRSEQEEQQAEAEVLGVPPLRGVGLSAASPRSQARCGDSAAIPNVHEFEPSVVWAAVEPSANRLAAGAAAGADGGGGGQAGAELWARSTTRGRGLGL